jgi:hypothetical protein
MTQTPKIKSEEEMRQEWYKIYGDDFDDSLRDKYCDYWLSIIKEREEGNIAKLVEGINEANWNMHLATKSRIITTIKNILK